MSGTSLPSNILINFLLGLPFIERGLKRKEARKISSLYSNESFEGKFAKVRFWDGPLEEIEKEVPRSGIILDLGCGEGILSNFLAVCSRGRKIIGLELNNHRIKLANRGLKNVTFRKVDITKVKLPICNAIVISHVLHHLPSYGDQEMVVAKCAERLGEGSKLIIAEVDKSFTPKYLLGWFVDAIIFPVLFEGRLYNFNFFHRSKRDWAGLLKKHGFKVKVKKGYSWRPFPDIILTAQKP